MDTSASNSSYPNPDPDPDPDLDADADTGPAIKLEKWIINTIKFRICKNNVLVITRIVKKRC
jgi:hypothetical protein